MISALTFLFWIYFFPVLGLALLSRADKVFTWGIGDIEYLALVPFVNLITFIFLIIFIIWGLFMYIFDLIAGNKP